MACRLLYTLKQYGISGNLLKWVYNYLSNRTFNPNETEALLFTYLQGQGYSILIFDGVNIKFVSQHKHLGFTLSENMKWKSHIDSILTSASHMIAIMRKLKYVFSRRALNQIYISYVRPVLEYLCMVWDGCTVEQRNSLEKLQTKQREL